MILKEVNLSNFPDKLPGFMIKYGNEMIDDYFAGDEELIEEDPNRLRNIYKLTKSGGESFAYPDSVLNRIFKIYKSDSNLIDKLLSDQKSFIQAMKGVPTDILLTKLWYLNSDISTFEDVTTYDFSVALNYIALAVCLKNRMTEVEEHCDMINDYIAKIDAVRNNFNYESVKLKTH